MIGRVTSMAEFLEQAAQTRATGTRWQTQRPQWEVLQHRARWQHTQLLKTEVPPPINRRERRPGL